MKEIVQVLFLGFMFFSCSFGMDEPLAEEKLFHVIPRKMTATPHLLGQLLSKDYGIQGEDMNDKPRIIICHLKKEREMVMRRRVTFFERVIFFNKLGPDCFELTREEELYKLTYIKGSPESHFPGTLLDGFKLFDTKDEIVFFLSQLSDSNALRHSTHRHLVDDLLRPFLEKEAEAKN
jgi:hypothetical protein